MEPEKLNRSVERPASRGQVLKKLQTHKKYTSKTQEEIRRCCVDAH